MPDNIGFADSTAAGSPDNFAVAADNSAEDVRVAENSAAEELVEIAEAGQVAQGTLAEPPAAVSGPARERCRSKYKTSSPLAAGHVRCCT